MLRDLTGGRSTVEAAGATVREVIDDLESRWPGLRDRLIDNGRLRPNLSVAVDGEVSPLGLRESVEPSSEIHFVAAIKGGSCALTKRVARQDAAVSLAIVQILGVQHLRATGLRGRQDKAVPE